MVSATRQAASQKRSRDGRSRAIYTHPRPEVTTGTGSPSPRGKDSEVQRDRGSLEMQGERETIERNCILPSTPPLCLQLFYGIVAVQSPSPGRLFATPWAAARQASLSSTVSHSLPKLTSHEWGMPSSHLILCCPPLLPPSIFPSIRLFFNRSTLSIDWPEYWSFSFSISPSNEYLGWISFGTEEYIFICYIIYIACQLLSHVQLFATPLTIARQSSLSMKFSRHKYWSGFPFPSRGDLPDPGIEPRSPAL